MALTVVATLMACAAYAGEGQATAYVMKDRGSEYARYAPVFLVNKSDKAFNRVGVPSARARGKGAPRVYVSPETPAFYVQRQEFTTAKGTYVNLVYRIHFQKSPFTLVPFNASAGRNVGLMAIITLDAQGTPLFVTTVHSCGCYHVAIPTSYLPADAYPEDYDLEGKTVFGERVPGRLDFPATFTHEWRPVVVLRPGTHRVMDVRVDNLEHVRRTMTVVEAEERPIDALDAIPIEGGTGTTSFYYTEGPKRGLVKGAFKPWEALLFGWWSGDLHVGQDRKYGACNDVGQLFYTTLDPSKRDESDMWRFDRFLRFNGWRI